MTKTPSISLTLIKASLTGPNLKKLLSKKKLSMWRIHKDCNISYQTLINWKNGRTPSDELAERVGKYLGLIKPQEGQSIAYIDYAQQEIAIAAALSQDENLKTAYKSGDPYLAFAKTAGAIPINGTRQTHPDERAKYKICVLALNYGMSVKSFSEKAKILFEYWIND